MSLRSKAPRAALWLILAVTAVLPACHSAAWRALTGTEDPAVPRQYVLAVTGMT